MKLLGKKPAIDHDPKANLRPWGRIGCFVVFLIGALSLGDRSISLAAVTILFCANDVRAS